MTLHLKLFTASTAGARPGPRRSLTSESLRARDKCGPFRGKSVDAVQYFREVNRMKRRRWALCAFLFLFGGFALLNGLNNPRLNNLHGADRLQLLASGLCLGVGLGVLLGGRKFLGESHGLTRPCNALPVIALPTEEHLVWRVIAKDTFRDQCQRKSMNSGFWWDDPRCGNTRRLTPRSS